jgi:plasmid stabilization system protein ParE
MALRWTVKGSSDLERLHASLSAVNPKAAHRVVHVLLAAVRRIPEQPRLGVRLADFAPREVRRLFIDDYEVRYELREEDIVILRLWHVREDR